MIPAENLVSPPFPRSLERIIAGQRAESVVPPAAWLAGWVAVPLFAKCRLPGSGTLAAERSSGVEASFLAPEPSAFGSFATGGAAAEATAE